MSSTKIDHGPMGRAEKQFREAFGRLKRGKPIHLAKGSKVTQNNVAREAGVDPSALRRTRFPTLVAEIQQWTEANGAVTGTTSPRQIALAKRTQNRGLRELIISLRMERDDALSKLVDAEATILHLTSENERLRVQLPNKLVAPIRPAQMGQAGSSK